MRGEGKFSTLAFSDLPGRGLSLAFSWIPPASSPSHSWLSAHGLQLLTGQCPRWVHTLVELGSSCQEVSWRSSIWGGS